MRNEVWGDHDWLSAWKTAIAEGTALCRACGDPARRMKPSGLNPGCYCRTCFKEIQYGSMPDVMNPRSWKAIRRKG